MSTPPAACFACAKARRRGMKSREGAVLFMSLAVMFVLLLVGTTAYLKGKADLLSAGFHAQDTQAFYFAEAGARYGVARITNDVANGNLTLDGASVSVFYSPPTGFNFDPVTTLTRLADGRSYLFTVRGFSGGADALLDVVVRARRSNPFAMQALNKITLSGNSGGTGSIRSNMGITTTGPIIGSATPGPGYTVSNPSVVTGSSAPADSPFSLDPVDAAAMAAAAVANNNAALAPYLKGADITVSGGAAVTVPPGVYHFGQMTFSGGSSMVLTGGVVTIYTTEKITFSGGTIVNTTLDPDNLWLFTTTNSEVKNSGTSTFYGHIYAPNAKKVEVSGGGDLVGSASSGGEIVLSGGSNYQSGGSGGDSGQTGIASWKQVY